MGQQGVSAMQAIYALRSTSYLRAGAVQTQRQWVFSRFRRLTALPNSRAALAAAYKKAHHTVIELEAPIPTHQVHLFLATPPHLKPQRAKAYTPKQHH